MTPNWRKPVGMLAIVAMLVAWCALIASASDYLIAWPWWGQLLFYIVAGVAWLWVLPLRRMLFWMEHGRWR